MTTLITKRRDSFFAKFLIGVTLVTSLSTFPHLVHADEITISDLYNTIKNKFRLSSTQVDNLMLVKARAQHPEPLEAIMLQESNAGANVRSNGNCHGPFQIMTSTAIAFLKAHKAIKEQYFGSSNPTPKLVASKLKHDVLFSIDVADGLYAGSLEKAKDEPHAIMVFNRGEGSLKVIRNPTHLVYVREVSAKLNNIVRPLNVLLAPIVSTADATARSESQEGLI